MFYYNKQQNQMLALSNETLKVNLVSDSDIGLLGVFDTSDTIALTVDYQLSLVDAINFTGNQERPIIAPIIVFVIVICSVFGCLLIAIGCFYGVKMINSRKRTLIRMNNEI